MKSDDAAELRKRLSDAQALCLALDLFPRGQRKPSKAGRGGWLVRCPWCNRGSDTPPCSVSPGPDRTLRAKCFSCGATGDALSLIAAVHGLDLRADFPAVLGEAARLVGVTLEASRRPFPSADVGPLTYPEASEVAALWEEAYPLEADDEARAYLEGRAVDPGAVDLYDLARVVQPWASAPSWARCRGKSWTSTHRLILPVIDHLGAMRSLRAWRVSPQLAGDDTPKRVAPAGKASAGLVLACPTARRMLATGQAPSWASEGALFDVIIAEGEPDFLTWASRVSDADETPPAVLGIGAGAWCEAIAARIPDGSRVIIRTHQDPSGDRYAAEIRASLAGRALQVLDLEREHHGQAA